VTFDLDFKVATFFEVKCLKTVRLTDNVTIEHSQETMRNLSNGTTFNDLE